jgi:hypothetical protein
MESRDDTRKRIEQVLGPSGHEVGCDECFELLDQYVELELAGEDPAARLPRVRNHLLGCPACEEDHESLRDLVALQAAGT